MLEPKDRKRLVVIGVALLVTWVVGDIVIGAAVQNTKEDQAKTASEAARASRFSRRTTYSRDHSVPNATFVLLEGIRNATLIPLRIAGILSAFLLLALSPIPEYLRLTKSKSASPPSAILAIGTAFSILGLLAIGVAQIVASNNTFTVTRTRQLSPEEKQRDLEARTMRNPPGHLVPPGYNPSEHIIIFGGDEVEMKRITEKVTEIDNKVALYVSVARVVGGILLFVGVAYSILAIQVRPPDRTKQPIEDSSATSDKTEE